MASLADDDHTMDLKLTPSDAGTLKKQPYTVDITGQMILLGTGTSVGVPSLGCGCPVCTSGHPRNQRTRCSAILGLPEGNLLIDTSPDLRLQIDSGKNRNCS